jgi:hypothetical protein
MASGTPEADVVELPEEVVAVAAPVLPVEVVAVPSPPLAGLVAVALPPAVLSVGETDVGVDVAVSQAASSGIRRTRTTSIEIKRAVPFIASFLLIAWRRSVVQVIYSRTRHKQNVTEPRLRIFGHV